MSLRDQDWDIKRFFEKTGQNFKFAYSNGITMEGRMIPKWDVTYTD